MSDLNPKYIVEVKVADRSLRLSEEVKRELKNMGMMDDKDKLKLVGISTKMLKQMKQEYVECPVLNSSISFIQCYVCTNFISRIKGKVYCSGNPL